MNTRDPDLIDISVPYAPSTPEWPGDTRFECGWRVRREDGHAINLAAITMSVHSGTHADAPLHAESHWPGSESLPIAAFVGECVVVTLPADVCGDVEITRDTLTRAITAVVGETSVSRVLVRTGASVADGDFPELWPAISEDAAQWLVRRGVVLLGVDAPSVDLRESKTLPVHHALFASGSYVLENLSLAHVDVGVYELLAQPVRVNGTDGAPVRALLRRER